jgi:hypothetical protein
MLASPVWGIGRSEGDDEQESHQPETGFEEFSQSFKDVRGYQESIQLSGAYATRQTS